ncbi:hypothetical protein RJ639_024993 [Escallonia herrerae]|uniref:Prohibitin n=1 Tax=Escallonia herrerae TaxID=1293975 RepID=A0AA88S6M4_9ASTE|nr:hypothetical protein RJ639_024993 [Escallonia herrerae]
MCLLQVLPLGGSSQLQLKLNRWLHRKLRGPSLWWKKLSKTSEVLSIIRAQGEAKSAQLIGHAIANNPAFITLRKIEAAREIAHKMSNSAKKDQTRELQLSETWVIALLAELLPSVVPSGVSCDLAEQRLLDVDSIRGISVD